MKKIFILLIVLSFYVQNVKSQSWDYLGSAQFAQGYSPDIAVQNGVVYVAFRDNSNNKKCSVMKFDGSSWVPVGDLGFTADEVREPSIEVSSSGEVYVAFKDYDQFNKCTVMKFDGSSWNVFGSPGIGGGTVDYVDLTLKQDEPVVAFQKNNSGAAVMEYNGSSFDFVSGSSGTTSGTANYIDIEVNNNNELLLAHRNILSLNQYATVRKYDGTNWVDEANPNFSTGDVAFTTLTIDGATNTPYVAFKDQSSGNSGDLVVMSSDGSTWQTVGNPSDTVIGTVDDMEIRFFDGRPYVACLEYYGSNKASVITYNGAVWTYVGSKAFSPGYSDKLKMTIDETNSKMYVTFTEGGYISVMTFDLNVLSIEDNQKQSIVELFPNPVQEQLNIELKDISTPLNVRITNVMGETVATLDATMGNNTIDVSRLNSGVYFLQTENGISIKFVKN